MQRKEFLTGCCAIGALLTTHESLAAHDAPGRSTLPLLQAQEPDPEKTFIQNWVSDLMGTLDSQFSEDDKRRLMAGCGRGCFNRHAFKRDIATAGKGDIDKLIEAYHANFEAWREGSDVHIRFGEVSTKCYCPAARYREPLPNDLHCYCTAGTHQAVFETALGRPVRVDILESVRRGGKTCHFLVHTSG